MNMRRTGARKVKTSFTAGHLTHFGGVYLLHSFLQQLQFRTFLSRRLQISERNNQFSISERIFAMIYPMILGLDRVELSALLGDNGVFQYLVGLPRFPDPTTLRRFMISKADKLLPRLRSAHNDLRSRLLIVPKQHSSYWLDFDSTAKTLYGNQEGVVKGYNPGNKGKKSYHPLICTEAHFQDCLGGKLRYGNAYTAEGVIDMLDSALSILPVSVRNIRVRADAGFYNKDFVAKLSENKIDFAIVARMTKRLKEKVPSLRYVKANKHMSTAQFEYHPVGWKTSHQFMVLREKLSEQRKEQLQLFTVDKYAYHAIITNLKLTPYAAFGFYEDRAAIERIIRTLKEDYPYGTAPTNNFQANVMYAELSLLAYNIINWFKRLCLPPKWQTYTLGTLRHKLLLIPGVFTKTGNRPTLKFPKNNPNKNIFEYAQNKIKKLKPLV